MLIRMNTSQSLGGSDSGSDQVCKGASVILKSPAVGDSLYFIYVLWTCSVGSKNGVPFTGLGERGAIYPMHCAGYDLCPV